MKKALCIWLIMAALPYISWANTESGDIDLLIEEDVRSLRADVRELEEHITSLKKMSERIKAKKNQASVATLDDNLWQEALTLFSEIEAKAANEDIAPQLQKMFGNLTQTFATISLVDQGTLSELNRLSRDFDRDGYENRVMDSLFEVYYEQVDQTKTLISADDVPVLNLMDNSLYIYPNFDLSQSVRKADVRDALPSLKAVFSVDLNSQWNKIRSALDESKNKASKALVDKIDAEIKNQQAKLSGKREELTTKIGQYKNLQQQEQNRRTQIDQSLVYAVYGMIVVLLLLFLGLKVFTDEVAKSLIENRSLVEVVGMAFMLITIIILGTGEKLSKEILGTLLGTIAGYVFARGTEDKDKDHK